MEKGRESMRGEPGTPAGAEFVDIPRPPGTRTLSLEEFASSVAAKIRATLKFKAGDDVTVGEVISISDPLQARWIAGHLPVEEIGRIRAIADAVFEDPNAAGAWLKEPNLATNGKAPVELLGTPEGFETLKNLLLRIEYGVLS